MSEWADYSKEDVFSMLHSKQAVFVKKKETARERLVLSTLLSRIDKRSHLGPY